MHAHSFVVLQSNPVELEPVLHELDKLIVSHPDDLPQHVNRLYSKTVNILIDCSNRVIPKHKKNVYKFWWNNELQELKLAAINSSKEWKSAGKSKTGSLFLKYKQDKLRYKQGIRHERERETNAYTNELHDALLKKTLVLHSGNAGTQNLKATSATK